jgi:hypothetical protein
MKIGVIIPWREQPSRVKPFEAVIDWYKTYLPQAKIYLPDHEGDIWLPSHTRNDGVRMAEEDECDILVVNDADTIPQLRPLLEAIKEASRDGKMHNPYTEYRILGDEGTKMYLGGINIKRCPYRKFKTACFGTLVTTAKTWWELGGMDEKFMQWGWEDTAMQRAHYIIKGSNFVSHPGIAFAMGHEPQPKLGSETFANNKRLYEERYLTVSDPQEMLDLVRSKD